MTVSSTTSTAPMGTSSAVAACSLVCRRARITSAAHLLRLIQRNAHVVLVGALQTM